MSNQTNSASTFNTLDEWLTYMQGIHVSAIDMGLSRVLPVAEHLGVVASAKQAYIFTVAGTNGKGSTTAVIAEICKQAGYKTALYQSPELIEFNERVRINGVPVADDKLIKAFEKVEQARIDCDLSLSFFEMTTLAAFLIFAESGCDVWVLEVGLGGRLDVVNIIDPNVALITNVGIDHVDWLGDDREKIGYEKAGILRKGIPLIYGEADMPATVMARIDELEVACYQAGRDFAYEVFSDMPQGAMSQTNNKQPQNWTYSNAAITMQLPMPALSLINVANAVSAVLSSQLAISQPHIAKAMKMVKLAGRFDYREQQGRRWLFDVAHNEHGVNFLLKQLQSNMASYLPDGGKVFMLFSMLADKDIEKVVGLLQTSSLPIEAWYVAPIDHPRAASLQQLQTVLDKNIHETINYADNLADATAKVMRVTNQQDLILVCGSFHTISECIQSL